MSWVRLNELPDCRLVDQRYNDLCYWEIRDQTVLHQGRKLRGADPGSFEVRADDHVLLGRDRAHVYQAWQRLPHVDRDSFEHVDASYFRDKRMAYCEFETSLKPLKGRTVREFAVLGGGFAKDDTYGYFCGLPIRGCTAPSTLRFLGQDEDDLVFARDQGGSALTA